MAPRKKEEAPVEAAPKATRKKAATAPMAADTTTSTPGNPTVCKTCNGHGATDRSSRQRGSRWWLARRQDRQLGTRRDAVCLLGE